MKRIKDFLVLPIGLLVIAFLVSACSPVNEKTNLTLFMLGEWRGEKEIKSGDRTVEIHTEFIFLPFNILLINTKSSEGQVYRDIFSYKFIEPDKVLLRGRLVDEIQITRDGEDLIINSVHGFPPDGKYIRIICLGKFFVLLVTIFLMLFPIWIKIGRKFSKRIKTSYSLLSFCPIGNDRREISRRLRLPPTGAAQARHRHEKAL